VEPASSKHLCNQFCKERGRKREAVCRKEDCVEVEEGGCSIATRATEIERVVHS
jgi:hypothetical protein